MISWYAGPVVASRVFRPSQPLRPRPLVGGRWSCGEWGAACHHHYSPGFQHINNITVRHQHFNTSTINSNSSYLNFYFLLLQLTVDLLIPSEYKKLTPLTTLLTLKLHSLYLSSKHNRRIKLLGDNKPCANIRVNGEWQYRSEGLSCQSEVIGLLIVLQNKRRLSRCVCLPLLATAHSDIDNTTNAKHWCLNDLDNDQLMEHFNQYLHIAFSWF